MTAIEWLFLVKWHFQPATLWHISQIGMESSSLRKLERRKYLQEFDIRENDIQLQT